jgi:hypothetical protein
LPPTERPDDKTINDDALIDAWYKEFQREQAKAVLRAKGKHVPEDRPPLPLFDGGTG